VGIARVIRLGRALLGLLTLAPTAQADTTAMTFCNNTRERVFVAFVYLHPQYNQWYHYAWQNIARGTCANVGSVVSGQLFYHAVNERKTLYWPADAYIARYYCYPNRAVNRKYGKSCERGETTAGYAQADVYGPNHTVNINP